MGIRTYRARSMADAIDAVQRELGRDAIILHTRNYKIGGLFGIGGRPVVEVTASPASVVRQRQRGQARPAQRSQPEQPADRMPAPPKPTAQRIPDTVEEPTSAQRRMELLERYTALASANASGGAPAGARAIQPAQSKPLSQGAPPPSAEKAPSRSARASGEDESPAPERMRVRSQAARGAETVEGELRSLRQLLGRMMHTQQAGPVSASALGEPLSELYVRLIESEVDRELADEVVSRVRYALTRDELCDEAAVRASLVGAMSACIPVCTPGRGRAADGPLTIALVGPTGVGKTTTIAKLAATYKLRRGLRVGLITTDTFRIAAVEQLRTYASIISVPLRVVMSPAEMASACRAMVDCDVVLIDTAGRSPRDGQRVEELSAYLEAAKPHETHLVLSSTAGAAALRSAAAGFAPAQPDRLLFTKLDEAESVGTVISTVHALGLPLSFVTTGQEVPDHIEPGRADRLARLVLGFQTPRERTEPSVQPQPKPAMVEAGV